MASSQTDKEDINYLISCLRHTDQAIDWSEVALEMGLGDTAAVKASKKALVF